MPAQPTMAQRSLSTRTFGLVKISRLTSERRPSRQQFIDNLSQKKSKEVAFFAQEKPLAFKEFLASDTGESQQARTQQHQRAGLRNSRDVAIDAHSRRPCLHNVDQGQRI